MRAAAERLAADGAVDVVLASPLRRTRRPPQAVGDLLGLEVREVDGFRECAFGEWEGLTFDEVRAGWPDELAEWLGDPAVAPPGGESFVDVRKRVLRARDQVLARYPRRPVLVVTHVTPIKMLVADALERVRCRRCTGWSSRPRRSPRCSGSSRARPRCAASTTRPTCTSPQLCADTPLTGGSGARAHSRWWSAAEPLAEHLGGVLAGAPAAAGPGA